ncbi:MAG: DUF928 domain-containing protein [Nitrospiraceae bacterium]|nr:DUF928 domain-containing protein [Nitrospiraceae bacterium]
MRRSMFLLAGLILSVGLCDPATTPAVADQPAVLQPGATDAVPLPLYQPPKKLTPRARVGGGLRGTDGNDPVLVALVPDHVGLTVKKTPVLNWFLSKPTTYPLKFTLIDIRSVTPLHEGPIPTPTQAGIQSINLKDWNLVLEADVQYRWYISAIRNPDSPSQDIVAGGVIERCEFSNCLVEMQVDLSCDQQSVVRNALRGFWYDAMACLCELIDANPSDQTLRRQRAALLNQIGLSGVAEWDLRSMQGSAK